jgi:hypothetical protein
MHIFGGSLKMGFSPDSAHFQLEALGNFLGVLRLFFVRATLSILLSKSISFDRKFYILI